MKDNAINKRDVFNIYVLYPLRSYTLDRAMEYKREA